VQATPGLEDARADEHAIDAGLVPFAEMSVTGSVGSATHAGWHARRLGLWIAQAGQAGSTVDEGFPGLAALTRPDGNVVARLPDWRAGILTADIPIGGEDD
jgi:predicted amidohydrolase